MSKLITLMQDLERVLDGNAYDGGGTVRLRSGRDLVRVAMADADVLCECIELELQLLRDGGGGSSLVPFVRFPSIRAGIAFGYWPPFGSTGPHEHTAWTITAVIHNRLDVRVYDWAQSYEGGTLVERQLVNAISPDVGFIGSPAIHDVHNSTADWSLALHVLSDQDGRRPDGYPNALFGGSSEIARDDPYRRLNAARLRRAKVMQMAELLRAAVDNPKPKSGMFQDFMVGGSAARICAILGLTEVTVAPLKRLRKIHPDLRLAVEQTGSQFRLLAYSGQRAHPQLDVTEDFSVPLAFIAAQTEFDVGSLPGALTTSERQLLARAVENSCLFEVAL